MVSRGDRRIFSPAPMDCNVPLPVGTPVTVSSMHQPHGCRQADYAFVKADGVDFAVLVHVASLKEAASGGPGLS